MKLFALVLALNSCFEVGHEPAQSVGADSISNRDIKWAHTIVGLHPAVTGKTREVLDHMRKTKADMNVLIEHLDDPSRFEAAHVLLTYLQAYLHRGKIPTGSGPWNGMTVTFDGKVSKVSADPRDRLKKDWVARLAGNKKVE
jgi:hypothetical protein